MWTAWSWLVPFLSDGAQHCCLGDAVPRGEGTGAFAGEVLVDDPFEHFLTESGAQFVCASVR